MTEDFRADKLLTVPELARHLGISDQTVRRYVRAKRVPFTRNPDGWPMIRLADVPASLIEATKKLSGARYRSSPPLSEAEGSVAATAAEIVYLRSQLERALGIIEQLTRRLGDHPINTLPEP
jgi:excisionase family DNA binding protein